MSSKNNGAYFPVGILVPMQEEVALLLEKLGDIKETHCGSRTFYWGTMHGKPIIVAQSGIGKVASALTATLLIQKFEAKSILITGVAGGIADTIRIGDLAIATKAVQHDMDCRPLFPQFEIPTRGISFFSPNEELVQKLDAAASLFLKQDLAKLVSAETLQALGIGQPSILHGLLVSGDQFIGTYNQWEKIRAEVMDALFVEMEGAGVAQVCHDFHIPWCSIRTISDKANAEAHVDFNRFLNDAAKIYTAGVVNKFVELL